MKSLLTKLLALQVVGTALTLLVLLKLIHPSIQQDQSARFAQKGQEAVQALERSCENAPSPLKPVGLQAALKTASEGPGVVWACAMTGDGHTLLNAGAPLPKTLGRRLRATSAATLTLETPDHRADATVFRSYVSKGSIGVVFVALSEKMRQTMIQQAEIRLCLWVVAVMASLTGVLFFLIKHSRQPIQQLMLHVKQLKVQPQAALLPIPRSGAEDVDAVAAAIHLLVAGQHPTDDKDELTDYRRSFQEAVIGFWRCTPEGHYLDMNTAMAGIFGYDDPQEMMRNVTDIGRQVAGEPGRRDEYIRLLQEQGAVSNFEALFQRHDGRTIWVSLNARAVRDSKGRMQCFEGTVEDITKRKRAEAERAHLANHLRLLLESSGEGIYGVNLQGACTFMNKAGAHMLGYQTNDLLGHKLHPIIQPRHPDGSAYPEERSYVYNSVQSKQARRVDDEVMWRKDGTYFPVEYTTSPLMEGDQINGAVVVFIDISKRKAFETEQKRLLTEALEQADRDPLTSLLNHRAFHKRLEEEADRAQREGLPLAVAILDVDNFKFFNDVYGHKVGDEVLQQVAAALRTCCRSYDTLARFGGDEFAILMPCKGPEDSAELAAVLRGRLEGVSYRPEGYDQPIPLNLSVGLALYPEEGVTRLAALEIADDRLRRAKTGGDEDGLAERVRATLNRSCEGFSMLDALVTAVDNKDRYTRRHSEDVMRYCLEIAQAMGLDDNVLRSVERAALIHDVGKIGVPDHILRKPGQLSDEEFAAIRQHPIMGAIIAEAVPGFADTLDAVRHHHERWDGEGYPFGLVGTDTPLIARLMAVADSFSAMTTDRPYRKGMAHEKALSILEKGAGTQWDPECVAAFVPARKAVLVK